MVWKDETVCWWKRSLNSSTAGVPNKCLFLERHIGVTAHYKWEEWGCFLSCPLAELSDQDQNLLVNPAADTTRCLHSYKESNLVRPQHQLTFITLTVLSSYRKDSRYELHYLKCNHPCPAGNAKTFVQISFLPVKLLALGNNLLLCCHVTSIHTTAVNITEDWLST